MVAFPFNFLRLFFLFCLQFAAVDELDTCTMADKKHNIYTTLKIYTSPPLPDFEAIGAALTSLYIGFESSRQKKFMSKSRTFVIWDEARPLSWECI
jgi:hypothetical protein